MSKSSRYQILSLSKLSSEEPYSVLISITVKRKSQTTEHLHSYFLSVGLALYLLLSDSHLFWKV